MKKEPHNLPASYKTEFLELYQKRVCDYYRITPEEFFTRQGEPRYNKKFNFVRGMFMYLCRMRKIQQEEMVRYFHSNGLQYTRTNIAAILCRTTIRINEDEDLLHIINRLK
jgi:hypothetical protein